MMLMLILMMAMMECAAAVVVVVEGFSSVFWTASVSLDCLHLTEQIELMMLMSQLNCLPFLRHPAAVAAVVDTVAICFANQTSPRFPPHLAAATQAAFAPQPDSTPRLFALLQTRGVHAHVRCGSPCALPTACDDVPADHAHIVTSMAWVMMQMTTE
jgi:hypothetical protein